MSRLKLLIRSIRENPVSITSARNPVERIFIMLSLSAGSVEPFRRRARQLRHLKFLLAPKRHKPARKRT